MRTLLARGLWIALLFAPLLAGLTHGDPGKADDDPIPGLIKQLGSGVYARRAAAVRQLEALGEKALPALREAAAQKDDLELRRRAQQLIIAGAPERRKSKSIGLTLASIPAGEFPMGSPNAERNRRAEEVSHRVQITEPFYLGTYEVTQEEYQKVTKTNPGWFASTGGGKSQVDEKTTNLFPVEQVSWFDAIEFCNLLSEKDGLTPYYKVTDLTRQAGSIKKASVAIVGGDGYRLPTEAEWEYACRAGTTTPFFFGVQNSGREANLLPGAGVGGYGGPPSWNPLRRTTNIAAYLPNRWGLYDTHGNAAEWCWDWYDKDYYANSPDNDPKGPKTGTHRVQRGGSWLVTEASCRSASRYFLLPGDRQYSTGFRVARYP